MEEKYLKKNLFLNYSRMLAKIIWSRERPVELLLVVQQDSTGRPLEYCKFASNILELPISLRNAIKIFTGRPLESTGHPVELLYRTSTRAEDLADYYFLKDMRSL